MRCLDGSDLLLLLGDALGDERVVLGLLLLLVLDLAGLDRVEVAAALETEEYKAAISTPWTLKFKGVATRFEPRLFKLHKAWDRE